MKYYQQYLNDEHSPGAIIKRILQIFGLIHFLLSAITFIYAIFIYWVFFLIPLSLFIDGIFWGCLSYLFSKDYMYEYEKGKFSAYYRNSHGKYKLLVSGEATVVPDAEEKIKKLTNRKEGITIVIEDKKYKISPDGLMENLLRENGKEDDLLGQRGDD
ncbi:MAG: hypothetical protein IJS93_00310 [Clostridia bacterium]|nr:hypothetical protein [Clostridia bacterium]